MASSFERRLLSQALSIVLAATLLVVVEAGPAHARPMPTNVDVQVSGDCSQTTVSWEGGAGQLLVRVSRHRLIGEPENGTLQFLDLYSEKVHARTGQMAHSWTPSPSQLIVTVQLYTAKGRNGANGDLITNMATFASCA